MKNILVLITVFFFIGVVAGILISPIKKGVIINVKETPVMPPQEPKKKAEVIPIKQVKPPIIKYAGPKLFENEDLLSEIIN